NGFRSGAGSFADLARRWAGGAPIAPAAPAAPEVVPEVGIAPPEPVVSEPPASASEPPLAASAPVPARAGAPVQVRYYGRTDVGLVREHNEDNFLVLDLTGNVRGVDAPREIEVGPRGLVLAVCDGMGGAAAGEVAS